MTKETRTCAACVSAGLGMLSLAVPAAAQPEYRVRAVAEFGYNGVAYSPADSYVLSGGEVRAELRGRNDAGESVAGIYAGTSLDTLRTILTNDGSSTLPLPEGGVARVTAIIDAAFAPAGLGVVRRGSMTAGTASG